MAVAMMEAAVQSRALRKARSAIGKVQRRVKRDKGARRTRAEERQAEVKKKPNMTRETIRMRLRMSLISAGRLTVRRCLVRDLG